MSISGLVVEYIVAIDVTRVRFPADALSVDALANSVMTHWCQHNPMAQGLKQNSRPPRPPREPSCTCPQPQALTAAPGGRPAPRGKFPTSAPLARHQVQGSIMAKRILTRALASML